MTERLSPSFDAVAADHFHHGDILALAYTGHDIIIVAVGLGYTDLRREGVAGLLPQSRINLPDQLPVRRAGNYILNLLKINDFYHGIR